MNALTTLRDTALARRDALNGNENQEKGLIQQAFDTALTPLRVATSRPAIKAYLTTLLFFVTSFVLISVSTTAYLFFYYNYIPQIGLTQTVYLQYDANVHPHATVPIDSSALISQQPYDIFVTLQLPRTPSNLAAGNFMMDVALMTDTVVSSGPLSYLLNTTTNGSPTATPIARSRRPAIMPYTSLVTSLPRKLLQLPMHLLSLKDLDATELKVPMFERLSFPRGRSNIPTTAHIEIQSQRLPSDCPPTSQPMIGLHLLSTPQTVTQTLQIYSAQIHFEARFQGLRFYVYNYRTLSFLIFSSLFYIFALTSMAIAYALISAMWSARNPETNLTTTRNSTKKIKSEDSLSDSTKIKSEDDKNLASIKAEDDSDAEPNQLDSTALANLSDTERTFPTLRGGQPLRYTPSTNTTAGSDEPEGLGISRDDLTHDAEDEDDDGSREQIITPISAEVKDEEEPFRGDSGIGTSMESENVPSGSVVRRRSSRGGSRGRRS